MVQECGSGKSNCKNWQARQGFVIHVYHYPLRTSKWSKIEHRPFCHITELARHALGCCWRQHLPRRIHPGHCRRMHSLVPFEVILVSHLVLILGSGSDIDRFFGRSTRPTVLVDRIGPYDRTYHAQSTGWHQLYCTKQRDPVTRL
jgi:hypothetical protein